MSILWKIVFILSVFAAGLIPTKHALHMFQQNRYETWRYSEWMKESTSGNVYKNILPLGLIVLTVVLGLAGLPVFVFVIAEILLVLYTQAMEKGEQYIKPLVYTDRVKRQILVTVVVDAVVVLGLVMFVPARIYCALLPAFSYLGPWVMIYPMAWITTPIEKAVHNWYINDAKRILKENPSLVKIGITGSYGKTTTKNIVQAVLSEEYMSLMTPASFNTPMGITRTIREMLKPIHQIFVCEMGADKVGDIKELMEFIHPSIGIVTSIGPQHLNTFGSQENIIREKMNMAEMLPEDGAAILNYDNAFIRDYKVKNSVQVITYGIHHQDVDYYAKDIVYTPGGSSFTVVHGEENVSIETKLLGELNILNILSAVAAARYLGVSWTVIKRACHTMKQVEHRLELKKINGFRFIDDAFNANPAGSAMALEVLSMMPGKRIIVTPGMIDLGAIQYETNKSFGRNMKGKADFVILVGENQTKTIYEGLKESGYDMNNVIVLNKEKEAFAYIWQNAAPTDTILLENDLPDAFNR